MSCQSSGKRALLTCKGEPETVACFFNLKSSEKDGEWVSWTVRGNDRIIIYDVDFLIHVTLWFFFKTGSCPAALLAPHPPCSTDVMKHVVILLPQFSPMLWLQIWTTMLSSTNSFQVCTYMTKLTPHMSTVTPIISLLNTSETALSVCACSSEHSASSSWCQCFSCVSLDIILGVGDIP